MSKHLEVIVREICIKVYPLSTVILPVLGHGDVATQSGALVWGWRTQKIPIKGGMIA